MHAVEHRRLQREGVYTFHATEVHDILPRSPCRLAEGGNAAVEAEIVFRLHLAELVKIQRAFHRVDPELLSRHEMDHRSAPGTIRAVAPHAPGDGLGFKREEDRSAVATAFVWLHCHSSCTSESDFRALCAAFQKQLRYRPWFTALQIRDA